MAGHRATDRRAAPRAGRSARSGGPPRVGLVLGAGGLVGQAYELGVLAALEEATGWDARSAELVVGSSAGSLTGALLRAGASAPDLVALALDEVPSEAGQRLLAPLGTWDAGELGRPDLGALARGWRVPPLRLVGRTIRRPWAFRPAVAAMTMRPAGQLDLLELAGVLDDLAPTWPDGLWICAARRDDGGRVVFGRGDGPRPPLSQAVAASCAIPGCFAPVSIDGVEHFDGAVHSPTSADVLAGQGLDLVVVVSPMSSHGADRSPVGAWRFAAHRRLDREVRRLRRSGTTVVCFEPTGPTRRAMGVNLMAEDRTREVVEAAAEEVRRRLARPSGVRLAHLLRGAAGRRAA